MILRVIDRLPMWLYSPWIKNLLAAIAVIISLSQSFFYIHRLETNLDEGAYLLKGWMFVSGKYYPYQEFGFWTNHMPLAFLIPGIVQTLFGPGLEVGRYFMIVVFGFSLTGLWLALKGLTNRWSYVAALWLIALNPVLIKMYSTAVSQGITACFLAWILALGIGGDKPTWKIILATILTSLLTLVRINLLPVPFFWVLYIFWRYGWRLGVVTLLVALIPFVFVHWFFWPNILQVYVRWLPRGIFPILDSWRLEGGVVGFWSPDLTVLNRLVSFFRTIRFHFALLLGSLMAVVIWRKNIYRMDRNLWKTLVFLFVLLWTLFAAHAWVTLTGDYCNYCLEGYVAFFVPIGIVLSLEALPYWPKTIGKWANPLLVLCGGLLGAGISLSLADDIRYGILYLPMPRLLLDFPYGGRETFLPVEVMRNVFTFLTDRQVHLIDILISGILFSLILILLIWLGFKLSQKHLAIKVSFGHFLLKSLLVFGFLFAPTSILSGGSYTYDCTSGTLHNYREIGERLNRLISPGSMVYWQSRAATPLLYVEGLNIYPPQINDIYSYYLNGQDNSLLRLGFWNESLARRWLKEADVIVIEERYFEGFVRQVIRNGKYKLVDVLPPLSFCRPQTKLRVYFPIR